jgi:hypothetical protein
VVVRTAVVLATLWLAGCASAATEPLPPTPRSGEPAAMVPIVENWSLVTGRVERWQPAAGDAAAEATVLIESVQPVVRPDGAVFANFLEARDGERVRIRFPEGVAERAGVAEDVRLRLQVRRGRDADLFFANAEHVEVLRAPR